MTQKCFLTATAEHHLDAANRGSNGRRSQPMFGGHEHTLRQTVIAVARRQARHGHNSAGEATVYILTGREWVSAGDLYWDGMPGDLIIAPDPRHTLHALEDAAVLRAVAKTPRQRRRRHDHDPGGTPPHPPPPSPAADARDPRRACAFDSP